MSCSHSSPSPGCNLCINRIIKTDVSVHPWGADDCVPPPSGVRPPQQPRCTAGGGKRPNAVNARGLLLLLQWQANARILTRLHFSFPHYSSLRVEGEGWVCSDTQTSTTCWQEAFILIGQLIRELFCSSTVCSILGNKINKATMF